MLIPELGVHQTSERYFFTPSSLAKELFYYPTRLGHYFCSSRYSFNHRSEIALQGDHNQNIMLFFVHDGAMELTLNGTPAIAGAGQIVLFDCREPYSYAASDGLEFTWLLFNGLNARAFYQKILQARGRRAFSPAAPAEIAQMLDSLRSACAEDARLSEARCSQLIHRGRRPYCTGHPLYEPAFVRADRRAGRGSSRQPESIAFLTAVQGADRLFTV